MEKGDRYRFPCHTNQKRYLSPFLAFFIALLVPFQLGTALAYAF